MTKTIPWDTGNGSITLTYSQSEGNQTVTVTSDSNQGSARSQYISISTGSIVRKVLVNQAAHVKQTGSLSAVPNGYSTTYSSYSTVSNATRANTNSSSTTYAQVTCKTGSRASSYFSLKFDLSSIPDNATITSVTCKFKARVSSTSYISTATGQLYANNTAVGSSVSCRSTSTTATYTISNTGSWTRTELDNLLLRLTATRGTSQTTKAAYLYVYGADLTINYEY